MQEKPYYTLTEVTLVFVNEGFTKYAVTKAIDRLRLLGEISVDPDPVDERVKRIRREYIDRIRKYLQTGQ